MTWPASHILFYDGDCGLCARSVRFVMDHDRRQLFKFCAISSQLGGQTYRALGLSPTDVSTFVAVIRGRAHVRSTAALEVAVSFGGLWKCFGVFRLIHVAWRDGLYDWVARNRHRFYKGKSTCSLMTREERKRFITDPVPE